MSPAPRLCKDPLNGSITFSKYPGKFFEHPLIFDGHVLIFTSVGVQLRAGTSKIHVFNSLIIIAVVAVIVVVVVVVILELTVIVIQ